MRKPAIVALILMAGTISPLRFGVSFAQPAPEAAASSAASTKATGLVNRARNATLDEDPHLHALADWERRQRRYFRDAGFSATAASVVSSRKVIVSCRYSVTFLSSWLK